MTTTPDTLPAAELHSVVLTHRNGGSTAHHDLTLDEARSLATRAIEQRRAASATILNADQRRVGTVEAFG